MIFLLWLLWSRFNFEKKVSHGLQDMTNIEPVCFIDLEGSHRMKKIQTLKKWKTFLEEKNSVINLTRALINAGKKLKDVNQLLKFI